MERIPASAAPRPQPTSLATAARHSRAAQMGSRLGAGLSALLVALVLVATMSVATASAAPARQTAERAHSAFVSSAPTSLSSTVARVSAAAPRPAYALSIRFTCASAVDYRYGNVCVRTAPYAALTIAVRYCSGYLAVSRSLRGTQCASSTGYKAWYWTPMTRCRGWATATVMALWHGQRSVNSIRFYVR